MREGNLKRLYGVFTHVGISQAHLLRKKHGLRFILPFRDAGKMADKTSCENSLLLCVMVCPEVYSLQLCYFVLGRLVLASLPVVLRCANKLLFSMLFVTYMCTM